MHDPSCAFGQWLAGTLSCTVAMRLEAMDKNIVHCEEKTVSFSLGHRYCTAVLHCSLPHRQNIICMWGAA
eukprot:1142289-Pelagomonas_calceolata.AAC.6